MAVVSDFADMSVVADEIGVFALEFSDEMIQLISQDELQPLHFVLDSNQDTGALDSGASRSRHEGAVGQDGGEEGSQEWITGVFSEAVSGGNDWRGRAGVQGVLVEHLCVIVEKDVANFFQLSLGIERAGLGNQIPIILSATERDAGTREENETVAKGTAEPVFVEMDAANFAGVDLGKRVQDIEAAF